jgi:hypothetical protein
MKQIIFSLMALALIFVSCKKDDEDVPPPPTGFQWPSGTGEYAPYTNGSTFVYQIESSAPVTVDSFTYTVVKDTTIGGLTYKKLESNKPLIAATFYCNYNAGVRTEITYNTDFQGVVTIPVLTQTVLKDNVPVTNSWNESLNVTVSGFPIPVTFTYTIQQKDFVKNILGKDYAATIAVKQIASIPSIIATQLGLPFSSIQIDNFFAKGVGLVQKEAANNITKIKRYNVVK